MGIPTITTSIIHETIAFWKTKGALGSFVSGRTTNVIKTPMKMPYTNPVKYLLNKNNFKRGYTIKNKSVNEKAMK
jgi:hypothetical protein